jgi:lactate dehydrogenase-like 2-hydroxyacid dehydrogenase
VELLSMSIGMSRSPQTVELDNVLWSPHISGGEPEYMISEAEAVLANIAKVVHGKSPQNLVPEFRS